MLKEEVIAQDGLAELPALRPHTAGARARPNLVTAPPESVRSCASVSERLFARSLVGSGEMARTSHKKPLRRLIRRRCPRHDSPTPHRRFH